MSEEKKCDQCGAPLADGAPEGLCPACLLKRGFETQTAGGVPAADFTPPPPEELARYFPQLEILELLGRGGMGVVYKARQRELDRLVALKILPSAADRDPAFAERFAREAKALGRLGHPNIVAVYDFGQAGGLFYFVMEYVDGLNLRQLLAMAKITPREALAIVPQICEALQTAHDQGIVHRDIKPENILLDKKGRVKIADFGIAKIMGGEERDVTLTGAGEVVGTPAYMAPEQIEHPREVDHRADIYSLGVVFYQMLTGELPLGKFAPPSSRMRGMQIDVRLDDVVLRALEKEPELRYQQASEVKTQVETIAGSPQRRTEGISSGGAAESMTSQALDRLRLQLIGIGVVMAISGIAAGNYLAVYVQKEAGIAMGAWGVLLCGVIAALAGTGRGDFERIRAAAQVVIIDSIGVVAVVMWLAWNTSDLPTPWRVCLMTIFGSMIMSGCLKLACVWPYGQGFWTPDTRKNQAAGYAAVYLGFLSGLIPTLFYWLRPWAAPWLSPRGQELMLWATLWVAICAVVLGLGARRSRMGRYGMVLGGISLTIWILFYIAGVLSGSRLGAGSYPEWLQESTNEIEPDGTVRFTEISSAVNRSGSALDRDEFNASSIVYVEKLTDAKGRPLRFNMTQRDKNLNHYYVFLYEPVPPGEKITTTMEGTLYDMVHATDKPGEYEYHMDHWPGYNGVTRRIETHRLPPEAELIDKSPEDLRVTHVGDHIELFIDRRIHAGGDIDVRYRYRMGSAPFKNKAPVEDQHGAPDTASKTASQSNTYQVDRQAIPESLFCNVQPDGAIAYLNTFEVSNETGKPMLTDHFTVSDFVHLKGYTDAKGRDIPFKEDLYGGFKRYTVTFNEPVPPGGTISITAKGTMTGVIKPTGKPGEFEYYRNYWPGRSEQYTETHLLPAGAELLEKSPSDLSQSSRDLRIQLKIERSIPAGGNLELRYKYRLPNAQAIEDQNATPTEQVLAEYDWQRLAAPVKVTSGTFVNIDGRSALKITNTTDGPLQLSLLKIDRPAITSMSYAISGEIKYDFVVGAGYLEMWNYFPPLHPGSQEGQYFSRTLGKPGSGPMGQIAGTSSWRTFSLPFNRTGTTNPPTRLEFNIFLPGRGVVYIGPLKLTQLVEPKENQYGK